MTLILREADIVPLVTMTDCVSWMEDAFRALGTGQGRNVPRHRVKHPQGLLHVLPAADLAAGAVGLKVYSTGRGGARFLVLLYSAASGELLAILEGDYLGQMRTGAASGVATKYLARQDAHRVGVIGTGSQARTQLAAVAAVRPIAEATAWSRDAARRERFCQEMSAQLGVPVRAAASAEGAVRDQDVVVTMTNSRDPVLHGEWLSPGTHVNAAGSNGLLRCEIDEETVRRADVIVVDSREQAKLECGDLLGPSEKGIVAWDQLAELGDVVAGHGPTRGSADQITLFESLGIGLEDVAAAMRVYERARERGIGQEIELFSELRPRAGR